ncbi:hypothetical protein GGF31_001845 [Allomyces arbusculus]|nr:hypothetical protein GGF31_001845 [Allomyces arbusculus]
MVIPTLPSLRGLEIATHVVSGLETVSAALFNRSVQTSLSVTFTIHVARSMGATTDFSERMRLLTEAVRALPRCLTSFTLDVMDDNTPDALYLLALPQLAKAVPLVTDTLSLVLPVFTREMVTVVPLAPTLRELSLTNWPAPRIFPVSALVSRLPPSLVSLMLRSMDFSLTDLVHPFVLPPRLRELQLLRIRTQRVLDQRYIAHLQQHGPVGAVLDAFTTNARHLATMYIDQLDGTNIDPAGWLEHVPRSVNRLSVVGHQLLDVVADAIISRLPRRAQRFPMARPDLFQLALAAPTLFAPAMRAVIRFADFSNHLIAEMFSPSYLAVDMEKPFCTVDGATEFVTGKYLYKTRKWFLTYAQKRYHVALAKAIQNLPSLSYLEIVAHIAEDIGMLAKAIPFATAGLDLCLPVITREMIDAMLFVPTLGELALTNWPALRLFPLSALVPRLPPSLTTLTLRNMQFSLPDLVHPLALPPTLRVLRMQRIRVQTVPNHRRSTAHMRKHGPAGVLPRGFTTKLRHLETLHMDEIEGINIVPAGGAS